MILRISYKKLFVHSTNELIVLFVKRKKSPKSLTLFISTKEKNCCMNNILVRTRV